MSSMLHPYSRMVDYSKATFIAYVLCSQLMGSAPGVQSFMPHGGDKAFYHVFSKKKISTFLQPCTGIESTCHGGRYHDHQLCRVFVLVGLVMSVHS